MYTGTPPSVQLPAILQALIYTPLVGYRPSKKGSQTLGQPPVGPHPSKEGSLTLGTPWRIGPHGHTPRNLTTLLLSPPRSSQSSEMVSTVTPIPRTPQQVAARVAEKMDYARESLFSKGEYLADPTTLDRIAWEPFGHGHQLVIKPVRAATPSPDIPESDDPAIETSTPSPNEDDSTSTRPTDIPLPAIEAAMEPSDAPLLLIRL